MSESQHPEAIWNDPRITAYTLGELSPEELAKFETEMAASPALAAAVEEAKVLTNQLMSHFASESTPPLDEGRRSVILSESTSVSQNLVEQKPWWKRRWVEYAIAATFVFIVIGLSLPVINAPLDVSLTTSERFGREEPENFRFKTTLEPTLEQSLRYQQPVPMVPLAKAADESELAEMAVTRSPMMRESLQSDLIQSGQLDAKADGIEVSAKGQADSQLGRDTAPRQLDADWRLADKSSRSLVAQEYDAAAYAVLPGTASSSSDNRGGMMGGAIGHSMGEMGAGMEGMGGGMGGGANPFGDAIDEGRGPGIAGDRFDPIIDNPFKRVSEHPLSTFSIDLDTASYSKVRSFLTRSNQLPRPDAVRIEEMVNYFDYAYEPPAADSEHPLVARAEIVSCPWNQSHRLARIALKGKTLASDQRPACNLVFLIDSSGSMNATNKLPLVQDGMKLLLSKLGPKDRVAIVVYAGSAGLVLPSTPASEHEKIRRALAELAAGGSTNGGDGITLAYQTARDNFIKDGVNRVILCTDGDFNVGTTGTDSLVRMLEDESKGGVFLTVLGFGMGNHNDAMLEQISGKGNGTYAYIDTINEARRVLVDQTDSTLVTIAKDVKFRLEFNPARVSAYRLIGYENRVLAKEDFNDDKKDAGEIGAGHTVTALYEIVPSGIQVDAIAPPVDALKYRKAASLTEAAKSDEVLMISLRYKAPDSDTSKLVEFPVSDEGKTFEQADIDVRFAVAVAGFGMKLRKSPYAGNWTFSEVEKTAEAAMGDDPFGLRAEFIELVQKAAAISGNEQ